MLPMNERSLSVQMAWVLGFVTLPPWALHPFWGGDEAQGWSPHVCRVLPLFVGGIQQWGFHPGLSPVS